MQFRTVSKFNIELFQSSISNCFKVLLHIRRPQLNCFRQCRLIMSKAILLSLCLMSIACGCTAEDYKCPPTADIEPCTCDPFTWPRPIRCANMTSTESLYAVFDKSGDYPFDTFVIENSTLMYLPSSAVKKKRIQELVIRNSTMASIFEFRPDPSNSLRIVRLSDTLFQRGIEWGFFSSFGKLQVLDCTNVEARKIGRLFKENINSDIDHIRIVNGKTAVLEDDVFSSLHKLTGIQVRNALLKTLKRSMFPPTSVLHYFDFRANRIKSLPEDMFRNMPYLKQIYLDENRLTTLPESLYADIYRRPRSYLTFFGNPLVCDCSLFWLFPKQIVSIVQGVCAEPPSKKGQQVSRLTPYDFPHCRTT